MNALLKISLLLILVSNTNSCSEKDLDGSIPAGDYTGTFTVSYADGSSHSGPVTVSFSGDNTYNSNGNEDRYPAGGKGSYSIKGDQFSFEDENLWTANFDWGLILNGEYTYSFTNDELTLTKTKDGSTTYTYVLSMD